MMNRLRQLLPTAFVMAVSAYASEPIDCRVIVGGMRECDPYSEHLLKARSVSYEQGMRRKLIVDKTLPVPKKQHLRVIPMEEMIERYIKVEEPKRFKGSGEKIIIPSPPKTVPPKLTPLPTKPSAKEENATMEIPSPVAKTPQKKTESAVPEYGTYTVKKGDTLGNIAVMFGMKSSKELLKLNTLKQKDALKIGQKLKIPLSQELVDTMATATYKVKEGESLISIARKFKLDPKLLAQHNHIDNTAQIRIGKILKLPLPYIMAAEKAKRKHIAKNKRNKKRKTYDSKFIRSFGKHKLRVTATAYSSHGNQTDSTPFLAAWNNRLRPGMKVIAVSRDLLYRYGMRNGTKVKIAGLPGYYRVRDKMNKRFKKRIDIYMGTNRRKALRWGRRSVVIYW